MKTALVLPVHNALEYTTRTLNALSATLPEGVPVVIVDDASDSDTARLLQTYVLCRNAFYLRNERQQLFTRTVNRGLRYLHHPPVYDAVAVVNSDCDLRPGWLDHLVQAMQIYPTLGMIGYRDQPDQAAFKKRSYTDVVFPGYVTGHCMLLRMKMLEQLGVFCETDLDGRDDPALKPFHGQAHIGSERILCWKSMAAGWHTMYCNYPVVFHEAGKSWNHDLGWLSQFRLDPLWEPCDTLDEPRWLTPDKE